MHSVRCSMQSPQTSKGQYPRHDIESETESTTLGDGKLAIDDQPSQQQQWQNHNKGNCQRQARADSETRLACRECTTTRAFLSQEKANATCSLHDGYEGKCQLTGSKPVLRYGFYYGKRPTCKWDLWFLIESRSNRVPVAVLVRTTVMGISRYPVCV